MNQYEFYGNFFKYRKRDDEIAHASLKYKLSNVMDRLTSHKYYTKTELPNGKIRYFYSKEEWDAYQNESRRERGFDKQNYTNNRRYAQNAGADRAAKERENAEKKAKEESVYLKRKALLEANQANREAAIKKAEPTAEEVQRRIDFAKARDKNAAEQEAKTNNPMKKFVDGVMKAIDKSVQDKNPIYKAAKKLQSETKKVKDYVDEHKYELERDLNVVKKERLDALDENIYDVNSALRKIARDNSYIPKSSVRKSALYTALEQYLKEENEGFVSIVDNFTNDGSLSSEDIKNAYDKLIVKIEDEINNMTVEDLAKERMRGV